MGVPLQKLSPWRAWEEATRRSMAIGVAGWALVSGLEAAGAIPVIYRWTLWPVSGAVTAFLTALVVSLAYYHGRWSLGIFGIVVAVLLPCLVNVLWVRFSGLSLLYPLVAVPLVGLIVLWELHRKISGRQLKLEQGTEEAVVREMMERDVLHTLPWADRILWLCISLGIVLLLLIQLVKR